jgi:hypothetical protein
MIQPQAKERLSRHLERVNHPTSSPVEPKSPTTNITIKKIPKNLEIVEGKRNLKRKTMVEEIEDNCIKASQGKLSSPEPVN